MRILVAEDDYICRRVLLMFFRGLGYKPISVENGLECLKLARTGAFDLIFMDLDMPEMTGTECTVEIRKAGLDIFIVAVTASSVPEARKFCLNHGMNAYIPKPFNGNLLKVALREASAYIGANRSAVA